jgi:hypothetical protein
MVEIWDVDPKDIYLMLHIQFYEVHKSYFKFKVRRLGVNNIAKLDQNYTRSINSNVNFYTKFNLNVLNAFGIITCGQTNTTTDKKISHMCVQFVGFSEECAISFGQFFKYANNSPAQNV